VEYYQQITQIYFHLRSKLLKKKNNELNPDKFKTHLQVKVHKYEGFQLKNSEETVIQTM